MNCPRCGRPTYSDNFCFACAFIGTKTKQNFSYTYTIVTSKPEYYIKKDLLSIWKEAEFIDGDKKIIIIKS